MSRNVAMLLIIAGATCMSFVGLLMRLLETTDGMVILFYRSITLAGMVGVVACLRRRQPPVAFLRSLDRTDLMMGLALAIAFMTYVYALLLTSVASALLLLTLSPFFAAILGWVWIGERPHILTWPAMAAALIGVALMISDGISLGRTAGNLVALVSSFSFAVMLVLARRSRRDDVLGGTFLGGVLALCMAGIAAGAIGEGLAISQSDLLLTLFMGAFTIGIGIALVTWGTGYVPAAEVSLLTLTESVLGPIWPWIFLGQAMTLTEIGGGAIVLGAVAMLALATREPRKVGLSRQDRHSA
jgi:drug/metabolite transporter (DMT)-like permease